MFLADSSSPLKPDTANSNSQTPLNGASRAQSNAPPPSSAPVTPARPVTQEETTKYAEKPPSSGAGGLFGITVRDQLLQVLFLNEPEIKTINKLPVFAQARDVLAIGLKYVNKARRIVALPDQNSIADVSWVKELNADMFTPLSVEELEALSAKPPPTPGQGKTGAESVWNTVRDLHLELIFM